MTITHLILQNKHRKKNILISPTIISYVLTKYEIKRLYLKSTILHFNHFQKVQKI